MSSLCTVTGLVLLFFQSTAIDNSLKPAGGIPAEQASDETVRKWYFIGGAVPGIVEKLSEDICKEPSTIPDSILLPKQPELSQSAHDVSVDWTHSWPCGASVYTIQWDDHYGNAQYQTIDGDTTRVTLANVSRCKTLDVCVNALFADGVDGKVCRLNWKTEKEKPIITGINVAYGKMTVFWKLGGGCKPQYFQLQVRKGQETIVTAMVPGENRVTKMDVRRIPAQFVVLVAAYYSDLESTVSDPKEVRATRYERRSEEAYCGPLQDRRVAQDARILVAEKNSNVNDPQGEKVLQMAGNLTCPILYYVLTFRVQESKSELGLPREQCKTISQMDADEYTVRVTLVTSASQMHSSPEIKLEGKKYWIVCSTPDLKVTFRPSETGETPLQTLKE
ncbi:hypothetical protein CRM22_004037 [Opisthorchis felineus]|uniref:Fibronectin type-III domain-containing protein n=1 Tax=Opisthorchis felineus TaxID=147828 RepID=A0A4S2M3D7_OPIFE|nr:hypothetical protein CRM22_004037 [Opisthorchis felineus]